GRGRGGGGHDPHRRGGGGGLLGRRSRLPRAVPRALRHPAGRDHRHGRGGPGGGGRPGDAHPGPPHHREGPRGRQAGVGGALGAVLAALSGEARAYSITRNSTSSTKKPAPMLLEPSMSQPKRIRKRTVWPGSASVSVT